MTYRYRFCPNCAGNFKNESDTLYVCPKCNFRIFINPKPAVGALIFNKKGQLLLLKRNHEPGKGSWGLVGGFLEIDETNEEGLRREIKEETGLNISNFKYFGSYAGNYLYMDIDYKIISTFYKVIIEESENVILSEEASEFIFIDLDKLNIDDIVLNDDKKVIRQLMNEEVNKTKSL